jgi:UDP-N-acetylglucosamine 2-epimerase (non-hydrolysing)
MNRRLVDTLAEHYFAPTPGAAENLRREGVATGRIVITGNTTVDALRLALARRGQAGEQDWRQRAGHLAHVLQTHRQVVLVTSHRRENQGPGLEGICRALLELSLRFPNLAIVFPVHFNPQVRAAVTGFLGGRERIYLTDPLDYDVFCHLMAESRLILTDSGGIQEEAPSLDKPVLVLRETSERPEAIQAGTARLVGTDTSSIVAAATELLTNQEEYRKMASAINPFGDGYAARRIVEYLLHNVM